MRCVVAEQMRDRNDRERFLAGIDLALAGLAVRCPAAGRVGARE